MKNTFETLLRWVCPVVCLAATGSGMAADAAAPKEVYIYVGTYTKESSEGIYLFRMDLATAAVRSVGLVAKAQNPSFLNFDPTGRFLYAVEEIGDFEGKKSGAVDAFAVGVGSGKLKFLNKLATGGGAPCHVSVDPSGKSVLVANYSGGSVAAYTIAKDGQLAERSSFIQHEGSSVNPRRQEGPHAHSINVSPDGRFAIVADLGLDKVFVYKLDAASGKLTPNDPPFTKVAPGSGPRHFSFSPDARFAYVVNEMASTVTVFDWDAAAGTLKEKQTITTLPKDFPGNDNTTAEVLVHPNGRFLYASNRGHNSIAVFGVGPGTGTLTPIEHESTQGKIPRGFAIDPTGQYLLAANQFSDNIVIFRINPLTGELDPTGQSLPVSMPVCVKMQAK